MKRKLSNLSLLLSLLCATSAYAQIPRVNTFFPIGGKAGETVDVEIRGANLDGAEKLLVQGAGVVGSVQPGGAKADETNKPVWQAKCQSCHELRSPANRSMTPAQWAATVERMVKVRQAPLSSEESARVTQYLVSAARAGRVTAQIKIEPNTLPGLYEMRVVTPRGLSSPGLFEVGTLPEVIGANGTREQAPPVTLPCVANGTLLNNGERHYFKFTARKGQRLVFNMKAYRYNDETQMFFNPNLRLYDGTGKQIAENHGYYDLDPLIDWTCPADGDYTLEARDLLGRGNPGSVYRLAMGAISYDTVVYPPAVQAGQKCSGTVAGKDVSSVPAFDIVARPQPGLTTVATPAGPQPFYASPVPVVTKESAQSSKTPVMLPAGFAGRITKPGEADTFAISGQGQVILEIYTRRIGSPANIRATVLNGKGQGVASVGGESRVLVNLEAGKPYSLKMEEASGQGGPEYVYFVEATHAYPNLEFVARPDSITLRPGMSTPVQVILTKREASEGDIAIRADNLPPGITASPCVIQPDRGDAWLVLTAAPDCKPIEQPIEIHATAKGPGGETTVRAIPQQIYRLNNEERAVNRETCVVAVRGQQDFTCTLETPEPIKVHPRKGAEVKIRIKRRDGYKSTLLFRTQGLPSGWTADWQNIGPDRNELTLTVRPDGNDPNPFLKRDPKLTPIRANVEVVADEYSFVVASFLVSRADKIEEDK